MKRRKFNLLAGTSVASAAAFGSTRAKAATPDPALLTTTLTPFGAERAGNADGSIPAWTGGLTSPPLGPTTPALVQLFTDERPLYTVDSSNLAQYAHLVSPATQVQITKFGWSLQVYQTHRTSAAPQYVYDNMAKNVTRAQLDPAGGRYGFVNAYGGVPFRSSTRLIRIRPAHRQYGITFPFLVDSRFKVYSLRATSKLMASRSSSTGQ